MDSSLNMIDLEYLTNPLYIKKKSICKKKSNKNEIAFYRKRIFKLTKDLLCNKEINSSVDNTFIHYAETCIKYFKFKDQSEIIQEDYVHIKKKEDPNANIMNEPLPNHLMMRKITPMSTKITDYIPIKIHRPDKAKPFIPVSRNIDISDSRYRTKGVSKKNINNKYEKKDKKKKKGEKKDKT
jgi:hypothetical protein